MRKTFWGFDRAGAAGLALPGAASAQNKIVIGIPTSPPNIVHMPAIVAKELGLYKKAGLDVEIVSLGDGTKVYRALLAGNIDFGLTPGAPTIIGRSNGADREGAFRQSAEVRSLDGRARRNQDHGRSQGQTYRHPGARRFCRHFEPQPYCAPQRSIRRKSTSSRSPARTCPRSLPIRSTPRSCMSSRKCSPRARCRTCMRSPACGSCNQRRSIRSCRRPKRRSRKSRTSCRRWSCQHRSHPDHVY